MIILPVGARRCAGADIQHLQVLPTAFLQRDAPPPTL
jgi:hypothetical protein